MLSHRVQSRCQKQKLMTQHWQSLHSSAWICCIHFLQPSSSRTVHTFYITKCPKKPKSNALFGSSIAFWPQQYFLIWFTGQCFKCFHYQTSSTQSDAENLNDHLLSLWLLFRLSIVRYNNKMGSSSSSDSSNHFQVQILLQLPNRVENAPTSKHPWRSCSPSEDGERSDWSSENWNAQHCKGGRQTKTCYLVPRRRAVALLPEHRQDGGWGLNCSR